MSCGCKDRAQAIMAASAAVVRGDGQEVVRQIQIVGASARSDLNQLKRAASIRLGLGRG